uniref:Regulatory protein zeste n=1 Tax=Diabrotica virgifera virgifera TaxID=50390 RepID=A0A6P7H2J5_DIAVI
MAQRSKKTQRAQYENLINFLENNPVLVTGKTRSSDPNKISNLWQAFANAENARGNGPPKTADQWKKIFNDWKVNTKKKSREIQVELNRTGGGVAVKKELTDLEERLLQLISSIHLGDPAIPDQLGGSTSQGVEVIDVPFEEENQYLTNEEEIIIEMEPPLEPALLDNTQGMSAR